MANDDDLLFYEEDLSSVLDAHVKSAPQVVDSIDEGQFLATDDKTLAEHVAAKMQLEPLCIFEDQKTLEQEDSGMQVARRRDQYFREPGSHYDVRSFRLTVTLPYSGDAWLWKYRPRQWRTTFPRAHVNSKDHRGVGTLKIVVEMPTEVEPERFKQEVERELESIRFYVGNHKKDVDEANRNLPGRIQDAILQRRKRLEKKAALLKAMDIPLKPRDGAATFAQIPLERKLIRPLPTAPNRPPEPGIRDEDYTHILGVLRHAGRTFEAAPQTFAVHDEEALRDIVLANLNGHYKGDATGETFRKNGKSDIRIESENRAAFVGECKIWEGEKELLSAIGQLSGYLTWRDCKAALVIFNKHVSGFTAIQQKVADVLRKHPNYVKDGVCTESGEWRFIFRSAEDPDHLITLHVFLFNIYAPEQKRSKR